MRSSTGTQKHITSLFCFNVVLINRSTATMKCAGSLINPEPHVVTGTLFDLCYKQSFTQVMLCPILECRMGVTYWNCVHVQFLWLCKKRRTFQYKFQDFTVPYRNIICSHKLTKMDRIVIEQRKELYRNAGCSLKRKWTKSLLGLNILLEYSSDILHRRPGFQASNFFLFPKGT
jgi:hypothetical protein